MSNRRSLDSQLASAVRHFWNTRTGQASKQAATGKRDQGSRGAVTGGKQMDGFVALVRDIVVECGLPSDCVNTESRLELPGYFRPEKKWDLYAF
jgi:hypothetical protein